MALMKAKPKQGFLKVGIYGPPGSGKTFTTLMVAEKLAESMGKRIAYFDTERGTDFYSMDVAQRQVHPNGFDFDVLHSVSMADITDEIMELDPNVYGVIVIDSISHIWDAAQAAYDGYKTRADTIPMQAWSKIKKPYKALLRILMDSSFHVFILGRQKNIFDTDPNTDQLIKTGVGMRAEGETEYEPHICLRMESQKDRKDSTKSTVLMLAEKDRTGIIQGNTFTNPTFEVFAPIMPLLNGKQAKSQNPDEVSAKDSELMDKETVKSLKTKITKAKDEKALNEVGLVIKDQKNRQFLTDDEIKTLRDHYDKKSSELAETVNF